MPGLISDSVLATLRSIEEQTMTDSAVIAETSVTIKCRVVDLHQPFHDRPLPNFFTQRRILILFPVGTVLKTGYHVTVNGADPYVALSVPPNESIQAAIIAEFLRPDDALRNQVVALTSGKDTTKSIQNLSVALWAAPLAPELHPLALNFDWAFGYPPGTTYPGGLSIREQDTISVSWFAKGAEISKPRFNADPFYPLMIALFREPG